MRADAARAEYSDWQASANQGASCHAVQEHRPHRHRTQCLVMACRRAPARRRKISAAPHHRGDTTALLALIAELRARASAKLGQAVEIACCFEAGRDGFWLHRLLTAHGIAAYVLEPTSILVNRRARRAKTDRLDAEGM